MKRFITGLFLIAALAYLPARACGTSFTLIPPGGVITGSPGQTVGWGFVISNDMNYALVTSANFCLDGTTDCFNPSPNFADFISLNRVVVGPPSESPVVSQMFNLSSQTGVGSFAIDSNSMFGDTVVGLIALTYNLYARSPNDPHFNPDTDLISNDNFLSADAAVITGPAQSVPESSTTLYLMGGALTGLVGLQWSWRRKAPAS